MELESAAAAVRQRLAEAEQATPAEAVAIFDDLHRQLQDSLAAVDQQLRTAAPGGGVPGGGALRRPGS